MKLSLRFWLSLFWGSLFVLCDLNAGTCLQDSTAQHFQWPERYLGTFGFEIMSDRANVIIVSSADSTSQAYRLGVRPGMEVLGWNTLPILKKLETMKVRKYRKLFPVTTDQNIKMILLTRGRPGETAEVFFMTPSGNNRGIRLRASL